VRIRSGWLLRLILLGPIVLLVAGTVAEILWRSFHLD
jgi:hypothetical protein